MYIQTLVVGINGGHGKQYVQSRPISLSTSARARDNDNKMIVNRNNKVQRSKIYIGDRVHAKDILQSSIFAIHN
jgi:hypothetical protein